LVEDSDRIIDSQAAIQIQPYKHTANFSFKTQSENQKAVFNVLQQA
jgi:hypothetical protein